MVLNVDEVAVLLAGRLADRGVGRTSAQGATTSPPGLPADKSFQSHKPLRINVNVSAQPNDSVHDLAPGNEGRRGSG